MIITCNKQLQSSPNMLASIADQNVNTLKHLLMMSSFGMKLFNSIYQTILPTCLNTQVLSDAQNVRKIGQVYNIRELKKHTSAIRDTRRKKMYQPLAYRVMDRFLNAGFELKEDIIKRQYNCKATGFWVNKSKESNFLLIMHEHLFVFQKA